MKGRSTGYYKDPPRSVGGFPIILHWRERVQDTCRLSPEVCLKEAGLGMTDVAPFNRNPSHLAQKKKHTAHLSRPWLCLRWGGDAVETDLINSTLEDGFVMGVCACECACRHAGLRACMRACVHKLGLCKRGCKTMLKSIYPHHLLTGTPLTGLHPALQVVEEAKMVGRLWPS